MHPFLPYITKWNMGMIRVSSRMIHLKLLCCGQSPIQGAPFILFFYDSNKRSTMEGSIVMLFARK